MKIIVVCLLILIASAVMQMNIQKTENSELKADCLIWRPVK